MLPATMSAGKGKARGVPTLPQSREDRWGWGGDATTLWGPRAQVTLSFSLLSAANKVFWELL